jgi:hypothetical protein
MSQDLSASDAVPAPRKSRGKWILTGVVALLLVCCGGIVIFLLSSSPLNKYVVAAGLPEPDRAYQTGTIYGYNLYVWNCYQNKHIVVFHWTSEMTSHPFSREEAACGATTPIETQLAGEKTRELDPNRFW